MEEGADILLKLRMMLDEDRQGVFVILIQSSVHVSPDRIKEYGVADFLDTGILITHVGYELPGIIVDHNTPEVEYYIPDSAH